MQHHGLTRQSCQYYYVEIYIAQAKWLF